MIFENLISQLNGKPRSGGTSFMCKCPCHDDRERSLSVKMMDHGIGVHCFAGCSKDAVKARLRALGLIPNTRRRYVKKK